MIDSEEPTRAPSRADPDSGSDDEMCDLRMLPRISERRGSEMTCTLEAELAVKLALQLNAQPQCLTTCAESTVDTSPPSRDMFTEFMELLDSYGQCCMVVAVVLVLARVLRCCGLLSTPLDVFLVAFPLGGWARYAMSRYEVFVEEQTDDCKSENCKACSHCDGGDCCPDDSCPYSSSFWSDLPKSDMAGNEERELAQAAEWPNEFLGKN